MKYSFSFCISLLFFISATAQYEHYGILTENAGSVFKMNQYGHPIELLHRFDTVNGAEPMGSLVQRADEMYGRTRIGGLNNSGVLYYVNTTSNSFSTVQHLPADYNDEFISPYTDGMNDFYYNTGCIGNTRGRLYKTNFSLNTISVAAEFIGYNTYYKPVMTLTDIFVPASLPTSNGSSVIFRFDIASQQVIDTIVMDPTVFGKGTFQLVQLNDSIAYGINYAGGIHGEGVISSLNLNSFVLDTLYSFNIPTIFYCSGIIGNSNLYLFNYNNTQTSFTGYSFANMQLDSLFTIPGGSQKSSRPGNIHFRGNQLVFSADNVTYNYNLTSQTLTTIAIADANQFGTTSFLNEPTIFYAPLSTQENDLDDIEIYPNPTSNFIHIKTSNKAQKTITLYSTDGRKLRVWNTTDENLQLDLSSFSTGFYLINIESAGKLRSKQIIKN